MRKTAGLSLQDEQSPQESIHALSTTTIKKGNRRAAFFLIVLAPLIAELAFGTTPLEMAWLILLWLPIYGAGILLVREVVRRTGRGWPSIVLLGFAYELIEDGIGLQALTSKHIYGAADWGARFLGLNLPYWEANVIYHIIFSAVIPILLTDLLFPSHRHAPYLKKSGLVITAFVALLGVAILRVSVPPSQDPGYSAPLAVTIGCVIAVAVLAIIALKVKTDRKQTLQTTDRVPSIWSLSIIGVVATLVVLALTFPIGGSKQPGFTEGWWVLVPMTLAAALAIRAYLAILHWSKSTKWTDLHALALAGGASVGHSLAGAFVGATIVDHIGLLIIAALTAWLVFLLGRRVKFRINNELVTNDDVPILFSDKGEMLG